MENYTQLRKRNAKLLETLPPELRLFGVVRNMPSKLRRGRYVLETILVKATSGAEAAIIADDLIYDLKLEYWGKDGTDIQTYQ